MAASGNAHGKKGGSHEGQLVLSQVVSNAVNARSSVLAFTSFHHYRLLVAGCGKSVVLYTHQFALLQIVDQVDSVVTALSWSKSGQIAVACHGKIYIYEPELVARPPNSAQCPYHWVHRHTLQQEDSHIICLSWAEDTMLLSGGSDICLWNAKPVNGAVLPDADSAGLRGKEGTSAGDGDCCDDSGDDGDHCCSDSHSDNDKGDDDDDDDDGDTSRAGGPTSDAHPAISPDTEGVRVRERVPREWSLAWTTTPPTPVSYLAFSPDRRLFVSCGKFDRMVKVWHHAAEGQGGYTFIYLPHPRSLSSIEWRPMPNQKGFTPNVLLTASRDGVVRLWSETSQNDSLHFYVCTVLDPVLSTPGFAISWLRRQAGVPQVDPASDDLSVTATVGTTNTVGSLGTSVGSTSASNPLGAHGHSNLGRTLGTTLSDETDWLISMNPDGTVYIWAIKGLYDEPRGTPRAVLWALDRCTRAAVDAPLLNIIAFATYETGRAMSTRGCVPDVISLITLDVHGHLAALLLQVTDDTEPPVRNPLVAKDIQVLTGAKVLLIGKELFAGHREPISSVLAHPSLALISSVSDDGHVLIRRLQSSTLCDTPLAIRHLATVPGLYNLVAWSADQPLLACANNTSISLYRIRHDHTTECDVTLLTELPGAQEVCPLGYLFMVTVQERPFVVGIGKDGAVMAAWSLDISGSTVTAQRLAVAFQETPVTCATRVPAPCTGLEHSPYEWMSCNAEGILSLWTLKASFREPCGFAIHKVSSIPLNRPGESVVSIASPYFGRFSTASASQTGYRFRIWEFESALPGLSLEYTVASPAGAQEPLMAWHEIVPGTHVLAITTPTHVAVYGPGKTSLSDLQFTNSEVPKWTEMSRISLLQSVPVTSITWTSNGELVFNIGPRLCVYTKWMRGCLHSHTLSEHVLQALRRAPDYHPQVLLSLALRNRLDLVELIIKSLQEEIIAHGDDAKDIKGFALRLSDLLVGCEGQAPSTGGHGANGSTTTTTTTTTTAAAPPEEDDDPWGRRPASAFAAAQESSDADLWGRTDPNKYSSLIDTPMTTSSGLGAGVGGPGSTFTMGSTVGLSHNAVGALTDALTRIALPRLTSAEQGLLLAVVNTMIDMKGKEKSLDENGLRFLLGLKMVAFQRHTVPASQRHTISLSSADILWALHSESQDMLCDEAVPQTVTWESIKNAGIPFWLKNPTKLKALADKLAKAQFSVDKEPLDAMLVYLAMGKKTTCIALFKAVKNTRLVDFMSNDFNEPRWVTAALKNAYVLMSKQEFVRAAAFFLLAGKVNDCVNVLNRNLQDTAFALFIARLVGGNDSELVQELLRDHLSECEATGDVFMQSCLLWQLKRYADALNAIVRSDPHAGHADSGDPCAVDCHQHGDLFRLGPQATMRITLPLVSVARFLARVPQLKSLPTALELEERLLFPTLSFYERTGSYAWGIELLLSEPASSQVSCAATGDESDPASSAMKVALIENSKYRQAARLLVQEIEAIERIKAHSSQEKEYEKLRDDFTWVSQHLGVESVRLGNALLRYCELQGYVYSGCVIQKCMTDTTTTPTQRATVPSLLNEILSSAREVTHLIEYMPVHQLSSRQATGLARTAQDLCRSLKLLPETPVSMRRLTPILLGEITLAIHAAIFLSAWTLGQHRTLQALLRHAPGRDGSADPMVPLETKLTRQLARITEVIAVQQDDQTRSRVCHDSDDDDHDHDTHHHPHDHGHGDGHGDDDDNDDDHHHDDGQEEDFHTKYRRHRVNSTTTKVQIYPGGEDDPKLLYLLALRKFFSDMEHYIDGVCGCKLTSLRSDAHSDLANVVRALSTWSLSLSNQNAAHSETPDLHTTPSASSDSEQTHPHVSVKDWIIAQSLHDTPASMPGGEGAEECCVDEKARASLWTYLSSADGVSSFLDVKGYNMDDYYRADSPEIRPSSNLATLDLGAKLSGATEVYKAKELITSICINRADPGWMAIASKKGVHELKLPAITHAHGTGSSAAMDIAGDSRAPQMGLELTRSSHFVDWVGGIGNTVESWASSSHQFLSQFALAPSTSITREQAVHALGSHPELPLYLAGGYNGSLTLWQFEHETSLASYTTTGNAKIHQIRFNTYGTKFGVCDNQGHLQLYQFESNSESLHSYEDLVTHTKTTRDFGFLTSGSFLATCGNSVGNRNMCLWDTLLPPHKAMVESVVCHEGGADCMAFASTRLVLITGGKKGDISIYDLRQRTIMTTIPAHSLAIKTIRISPNEDFFVTGSTDGDIKVWDMVSFKLLETSKNAHEKRTFFLGSGGGSGAVSHYGVRDIQFAGDHMYSCGADGRVLRVSFT